jgi:hypothetical protein
VTSPEEKTIRPILRRQALGSASFTRLQREIPAVMNWPAATPVKRWVLLANWLW